MLADSPDSAPPPDLAPASTPPTLIDSHCHLDLLEHRGLDIDAALQRARAAGVIGVLTIATRADGFDRLLGITERFPNVWRSVGVHPHETGSTPPLDTAQLVAETHHPKTIAIGETGLDYYYEHSPRAAQRHSFRAHIAAARATGLPLIVHTRDAEADTIAILREEYAIWPFRGLIHCFSASADLATAALALGFSLSFSGVLTFKNAAALRAIAATTPLDRLLAETDAPYLAPAPHRGRTNEPALLVHTAAVLAAAQGISEATLAAATTASFFRLFQKAVLQ